MTPAGLRKSDVKKAPRGTLTKNRLLLETFLRTVALLHPDTATVVRYAQISVDLERKRTPIPENDVWIAAVALECAKAAGHPRRPLQPRHRLAAFALVRWHPQVALGFAILPASSFFIAERSNFNISAANFGRMSFRVIRSRAISPSGLSRTEALVLTAVVIVLGWVGVLAFGRYLERSRLEHGVESARTLNTLLAQYATDNNGVYPVGEGTRAEGKSEGIALDLLQNDYTPNADIFAVGSTPRYRGTAKDYSDLAAENMSWDFTAGANVTTGIVAADASEWLPILYTTGEMVDYASAKGRGLELTPSGKGPFGKEGVVVAYKSGYATFIPAKPDKREIPPAFIMSNFKDTGTYTQIRP
jgi:hypothetical protein